MGNLLLVISFQCCTREGRESKATNENTRLLSVSS